MFYLIIFVILFIFSILEISNINKTSHKILIGFSWLILVLIAGLRYETGGDWEGYTPMFEKINPILSVFSGQGFGYGTEIGFLLLCSTVKQLGGSIQVVYFLVVLFNITLITKSLTEHVKYVILGLLVYYCILYFTLEMIQTRQSIAVAISFFALKYIKQERFFKYLFFIALAVLFHRSALLMIPFYFVFKKHILSVTMIIIVAVGCLLMLFQIPWIATVFVSVSKILGDEFYRRAIFYTTTNIYVVHRAISLGLFLNLGLFILFLWRKKKIDKQPLGNIFLNVFFVNLIVYFYFAELLEVSTRLRSYYIISVIVLFPYLVETLRIYKNKLIVFMFIFVYCFLYNRMIFLSRPEASAYNPYQNYLIYKVFDKRSTGKERLEESHKHFREHRKELEKK